MKSVFNSLEVWHKDDKGRLVSHNIPLTFGSGEKGVIAQDYTNAQINSGNTRVIPSCYLTLDAISRADGRSTNKNIKIRVSKKDYYYNSTPWDFIFTATVRCRGLQEACQIVEQVTPFFNPCLNLDCIDSAFTDEPTRIPISLDGVDMSVYDYDENSSNIYTVTISCTLHGWIYQPVTSGMVIYDKILNFNFNDKVAFRSFYDDDIKKPSDSKFEIIDIIQKDNELTAIIEHDDGLIITPEWTGIGAEIVASNGLTIKVKAESKYKIQLTIKDQFGNFKTMTKHFNKPRYL